MENQKSNKTRIHGNILPKVVNFFLFLRINLPFFIEDLLKKINIKQIIDPYITEIQDKNTYYPHL